MFAPFLALTRLRNIVKGDVVSDDADTRRRRRRGGGRGGMGRSDGNKVKKGKKYGVENEEMKRV